MSVDKYMHEIYIGVSGLMGALVLVTNKAKSNLRSGLVALFTGVNSAVFLTPLFTAMPVVKDLGKLTNHRIDFAIGFILGTVGWVGVLWLQDKIFKKKNGNTSDGI